MTRSNDPLDVFREDPTRASIGALLLLLVAVLVLMAIILPGLPPGR